MLWSPGTAPQYSHFADKEIVTQLERGVNTLVDRTLLGNEVGDFPHFLSSAIICDILTMPNFNENYANSL
jgi:hypothetical protein